jgi:hypothetical protein
MEKGSKLVMTRCHDTVVVGDNHRPLQVHMPEQRRHDWLVRQGTQTAMKPTTEIIWRTYGQTRLMRITKPAQCLFGGRVGS